MLELKEHKQLTQDKQTEVLPAPEKVHIPLSQHLGKICLPLVKIGDRVEAGQKIASVAAHVTSPVHASISGEVSAIGSWPHPVLGSSRAITIENDGRNKSAVPFLRRSQKEVDALSKQQIIEMIGECGVVGMGGAGFPTAVKLSPPKPVDTLIVNGAECEPFITSDYRLMLEKTGEIISAVNLVARCLTVKQVYIAVEDNKPEAIKRLKNNSGAIKIKVLKTRYPQGGERQLVKSVLGRKIPSGKLPFDAGVVVQNVATLYAVYEAVYFNKPLYERVVTVTGSIVNNPKNILAPIGAPISELIDFSSPLSGVPYKIIIGGPMMGVAQFSLEAPVIKTTNAVLLFDEKQAQAREESVCIRCGKCIKQCPAGLMPCMLNLASSKARWDEAKAYGVLDCMECGACNYVCPAARRIVQSVKRAKIEVSR